MCLKFFLRTVDRNILHMKWINKKNYNRSFSLVKNQMEKWAQLLDSQKEWDKFSSWGACIINNIKIVLAVITNLHSLNTLWMITDS